MTTDMPLARIVVTCLAKRCMIDSRAEKYEVAVASNTRAGSARWFFIPKELWESTKIGGTIPAEVLT